MTNIRLTAERRALGVALGLAFAATLAAPAPADPPAALGARRAAGEAFRDWRLRCTGAGCTLGLAIAGADGSPVLALVARGPGEAGALAFRTPLPLYLPDGLALGIGEEEPFLVPWRTCGPAGCEAVAPLSADLIAALRRERAAEATLTLADGLRVRLAVSLLGFTAGWEAMAERSPAPPPPAPEARDAGAATDAEPGPRPAPRLSPP